MRIVHVCLAFYPCSIWGGPPEIVLGHARGLQSRGHDVSILTSNVLDAETRIDTKTTHAVWEGIPVTYLQSYWLGRTDNSTGFILTPDLIRHTSMLRQADVIHLHEYRHFLFTAISPFAHLFRKPVVWQAHGTMTPQFGRVGLKARYDQMIGRRIASRFRGAVALTDEEVGQYQALGIDPHAIHKIPNPVNLAAQKEPADPNRFRTRFAIPDGDKIILYLARLHERKGLDGLIRAFAALDRPHTHLAIVGPDGGYRATAEATVQALQLDEKVTFTGPLFDQDKYDAYAAADLYVLPSIGGEGLPTTIIEALATQTPILLTDVIEVSQLIHNRAGLSVPYGIDSLRQGLHQLLEDQTRLAQYAADTTVVLNENFSLERVIDKLEVCYRQAVTGKS